MADASDRVQTPLRLERDLHAWLKAYAAAHLVSVNFVIEGLVRNFKDQQEARPGGPDRFWAPKGKT